tara:strand:+ start:2910 stop:3923 length:1014 start_codon:yes stop_codon:yes gene_type:complete
MNPIPSIIKEKINKHSNLSRNDSITLQTTNILNINGEKKFHNIINLEIINNIRWINKFHEHVNNYLYDQSIYVSCGETIEQRQKRNKIKIPIGFKNIFLFIDFVYKRVIPKLPILKKIYFFVTKGHNRVLSKAEMLGRLISCGFEILEVFEYENIQYIISKKVSDPKYDMEPSYGLLFNMRRIGYEGKIIKVFKLRTMHPYSEYCQDFIIKQNNLSSSGKVFDDFRVTYWGKIFRKYWLDELPMIINFIKRDLNLVGVRPLSQNYFSKYPEDLQESRVKIKPGLIPPYYADMPKNFEEILDSERKYLILKKKHPILTDIKYLFKVFINIVLKGARSH